MTSLASNEIFKISLNIKLIFILTFIFIILIISFYFFDLKNLIYNNKIFNNENIRFNFFQILTEKNQLFLNKIYNFPTNFITILLVNYLFLTLIATVKITNIFKGPIRTKLN